MPKYPFTALQIAVPVAEKATPAAPRERDLRGSLARQTPLRLGQLS
jgi:hypothetical protein